MITNYEEKIISTVLNHAGTLEEIRGGLNVNYFLNPQTRSLYQAILTYVEKTDGVVPTVTLLKDHLSIEEPTHAQLLHGLLDRIMDSAEPNDYQHTSFYVMQVHRDWQSQEIQKNIKDVIGALKGNDIATAISILQQDNFQTKDKHVVGNLERDFVAHMDDITYRQNNPKLFEGIPLGFSGIDLYAHGHCKKELIVIIGGTGVGKSLILGQVGVNVARRKKRVLLVTVENDKRSYMNRLYSNLSEVPYWKFKTAQFEQRDKDKWMEAMGMLPEDFCLEVVEFPEGCSARDIWFYMRGISAKFDYLVVDQITNMYPNGFDPNNVSRGLTPMSWQWFGQIALDLKRLASYAYGNEGIPVLTAAQAAGGIAGKKDLTTDDIAMAKIIAHHSHGVFFVTRDGDNYNMGASKYRDARIETFPVFPRFEFYQITDHPTGSSGQTVDSQVPLPQEEKPKIEQTLAAEFGESVPDSIDDVDKLI